MASTSRLKAIRKRYKGSVRHKRAQERRTLDTLCFTCEQCGAEPSEACEPGCKDAERFGYPTREHR